MLAQPQIDIKSFMGIDVSKETLDISLNFQSVKIKNNSNDIENFIAKELKGISINLCALESTGGYERLAINTLTKHGINVARAHPNKVYAFAKAANHFAKTDKLDAILLEKYAKFISDNATESQPVIIQKPSETQEELRELHAIEKDLLNIIHANQCREKLLTGKAKEIIQSLLEFDNKQLVELRKCMNSMIKCDKEFARKKELLMSYKSIADVTANTLIAALPELGRLSGKKIACLVGVAPRTFQSGQKDGNRHIFGGRFYVRRALYMAALVAMRHNNYLSEIYDKQVKNGKAKKVALVAIMRKMLVHLNAMVRDNSKCSIPGAAK